MNNFKDSYDDRPYFADSREWLIKTLFYDFDFFLDGKKISEKFVRKILGTDKLFALSKTAIYEMTIHLSNGKILETKFK